MHQEKLAEMGRREGISRHCQQSKLLEQTFSGIIGCTKYASAGENCRETQETQQKQGRETLVGETEEEEKTKVSHFSPSTACSLSSEAANLTRARVFRQP